MSFLHYIDKKKHDSWKDCKSCDSCDEERLEIKPSEMFKPHICVTGNIPDVADPKSFCDVMLHLQALNLNGLSQARDPQWLFCLSCRLQHYRLLGSSSSYQSKPGGTFSSPLYSSPVPIGNVALSQPRHTASDIIHYMKVDDTQI